MRILAVLITTTPHKIRLDIIWTCAIIRSENKGASPLIAIYTAIKKAGTVLSSSMYTKTDLKDIFGERNAAKLLEGTRIDDEKLFWQLASAFDK